MAVVTDSESGEKARKKSGAGDVGLLAGGSRTTPGGPQKPRSRSWGLVVLAGLLVVGTGLAVAAWGLSAGDRVSVLAVGQPVAKGEVVERSDLVSVSVAGVNGAIPVEEVETVVGKTAVVDLVDGQVLTDSMVTADPVPGAGKALVGLSLELTRVPSSGLAPGDYVDVIAVPAGEAAPKAGRAGQRELDAPKALSEGAMVHAVGGEAVDGSYVLLTLVVDAADARGITAYSTLNRVAVVETTPPAGAADEAAGE